MTDHRIVTREELYQLVWSQPMQTLAKQFGVSGPGLAKICARLDVPYPYRGYWARVGAGQHAAQYQLRKAKAGTPQSVEIKSTPAKAAPVTDAGRGPGADEAAKPLDKPLPAAVKVSGRLASPHRIIAAWIEEDRRRQSAWGGTTTRNAKFEAQQRRERLILDAIFKALERRGHKVETERGGLHLVRLVIAGRPFSYKFRERYTQKREPLSKEEMKDPWSVRDGRSTKVVRHDTGELVLAIQSAEFQWTIKAEWKDRSDQALEAQLGEMIVRLEGLADAANAAKVEQEEAARRRAIEDQRRYEAEQQRKRDENQLRRLRELAERRSEADRVRAFVAALREQAGNEPAPDLAAWLVWAQANADALDPLSHGVDAIKADVEAVTAWDYR